LTIEEISIF